MKKYLYLFIIVFSVFSCKNETLELPQIAQSGLSNIQNHTEIWVFYEENHGIPKAKVNKNNIIGSTDWIVNIDKKLPLSEVIPVFQMLKAKRSKKSPHSVEGMKNYLSYSNTVDQQISLFSIDSIQYMMQSIEELEKLQKSFSAKYSIRFFANVVDFNHQMYSVEKWKAFSLDSLAPGSMQLYFNSKMTYQQYLEYRILLQQKLSKQVSIEPIEYIIK
jgi:hypothetical protein